MRSTSTFALVIPDLTNPFFPELATVMLQNAAHAGYDAVILNLAAVEPRTDDDQDADSRGTAQDTDIPADLAAKPTKACVRHAAKLHYRLSRPARISLQTTGAKAASRTFEVMRTGSPVTLTYYFAASRTRRHDAHACAGGTQRSPEHRTV